MYRPPPSQPEKGLPHEVAPQGDRFPELSPEEWTLFCHLAHGYTIKRAAKEMGVLPYRGEIFKTNVIRNAGFNDMVGLVRTAIDNGIVKMPEGEELKKACRLYDALPPFNKRILQRVVAGETDEQIAVGLGEPDKPLSPKYIQTERRDIRLRMGTPTEAELIRAYVAVERHHTPEEMAAGRAASYRTPAGARSFVETIPGKTGRELGD